VKTVNIGTQDEEVLSEAQRLGLPPELSAGQIPGIDVRPLDAITGKTGIGRNVQGRL